jgi:hypothetical protein
VLDGLQGGLAHLAQIGQILRLKNRPGNVHDSKGADWSVAGP